MNKDELKKDLCDDLERFHEASKNIELYFDKCKELNIEPDNEIVVELNDAVWDSIQTACGYLEEVNNELEMEAEVETEAVEMEAEQAEKGAGRTPQRNQKDIYGAVPDFGGADQGTHRDD